MFFFSKLVTNGKFGTQDVPYNRKHTKQMKHLHVCKLLLVLLMCQA